MLFDYHAIPTDSSHIDEVIENRARTAGEYLLPGGAWRYYPRRDTVVFSKGTVSAVGAFSYPLAVPGSTECPGCRARFTVDERDAPPEKIPKDNLTVVLDREACGRKLVYRTWRDDDFFVPFGQKRRTSVKSFLAKQKLSKAERAARGVVEGRAGTIVWIPGIRLSDLVRVTSGTRKILKILYQSCPAAV